MNEFTGMVDAGDEIRMQTTVVEEHLISQPVSLRLTINSLCAEIIYKA